MTSLGKFLAFVNLLIGVAMVSWSVSLYVQRPGWFNPKSDDVYPAGQEAENFALLKDEIDNLGRAAVAAGTEWGAQRKRLEGLEKQRSDRLKGYTERLEWARNGRPTDPNQTGFFAPVYDSTSGLIDLTSVGDPLLGPDTLPLRGVTLLGKTTTADVNDTIKSTQASLAARKNYAAIGITILQTETRLLKMSEIRESVQAELFFLETFEVNVYETRETVLRRKKQLADRLGELGIKN